MKSLKVINIRKTFLALSILSILFITLLTTASAQNFFLNPDLIQTKHRFQTPVFNSTQLNKLDLPGISLAITSPSEDTGRHDLAFQYNGYDDNKEMWFTNVVLKGNATDLQDGVLSDYDLAWSTNRSDLQAGILAFGNVTSVRLYSNTCTGTEHVITLSATDSDGNTVTTKRNIRIWIVC